MSNIDIIPQSFKPGLTSSSFTQTVKNTLPLSRPNEASEDPSKSSSQTKLNIIPKVRNHLDLIAQKTDNRPAVNQSLSS